jgi:hypothetical protein
MRSTPSNWEDELGRWLKPFLDRLDHKARRRMCPLYVAGLIGPGERKRRRATTISWIILLLPGSGMRRHWRLNCSFKQTGWSAAGMRCW